MGNNRLPHHPNRNDEQLRAVTLTSSNHIRDRRKSCAPDHNLQDPSADARVWSSAQMTLTRKPSNPARGGLLSWKDILPWQRDNEYILTSYRPASFSYFKSLSSIFQLHNETANIWSHLLGALWFILLFLDFFYLKRVTSRPSLEDSLALGLYYLCVAVCFLLSTSFHTFSDHSPGMHKFGNELDHLGIVLVMWGTGMSGAHFAFRCRPPTRAAYFALLSATALGCGVFTLRPTFRKPAYRTARFLLYVFLGASLFAPVAHGWRAFGLARLEAMMGLRSFLGLAVVNFAGAAVYAARIPERWFPGTFDLLGQSHNWMHVLVLTGALVRLRGLLEVADAWQEGGMVHGLCERM